MVGHGGFFNNRIKYLTKKQNKSNTASCNNNDQDQSDEELSSPNDDLFFLNKCVVKTTDLNVIALKLNSTRELRKNMMRDAEVDLRESFSFFFAEPKLVTFFESVLLY